MATLDLQATLDGAQADSYSNYYPVGVYALPGGEYGFANWQPHKGLDRGWVFECCFINGDRFDDEQYAFAQYLEAIADAAEHRAKMARENAIEARRAIA